VTNRYFGAAVRCEATTFHVFPAVNDRRHGRQCLYVHLLECLNPAMFQGDQGAGIVSLPSKYAIHSALRGCIARRACFAIK